MTPRPTAVVAHFLDVSATVGMVLAMPASEKAQMRFIVNPNKILHHCDNIFTCVCPPGTMTDAKACQTSVSKAANATFFVSESFSLNH